MGFMKGTAAVRRTVKFIQKGFQLSKNIQAVVIQWNPDDKGPRNEGIDKFVFWHFCQLQFMNKNVHFTTLHKMTPSPWIQLYFDDGEEALVDCDCRPRIEILKLMKSAFGEKVGDTKTTEYNPGFGEDFPRHCICEVPGQVPCPSFEPVPEFVRNKYCKEKKKLED